MVQAKLIPSYPLPALTVARCREIVAHARSDSARIVTNARTKAAKRLLALRERSRISGIAKGYSEWQSQLSTLLDSTNTAYADALKRARADTIRLAVELAEEILGSELTRSPSHYEAWLTEALQILGESDRPVLQYHPELSEIISKLGDFSHRIRSHEPAPTLAPLTVRLVGNDGAVEFAWREALTRLSESKR